jgi:hypothetical protein
MLEHRLSGPMARPAALEAIFALGLAFALLPSLGCGGESALFPYDGAAYSSVDATGGTAGAGTGGQGAGGGGGAAPGTGGAADAGAGGHLGSGGATDDGAAGATGSGGAVDAATDVVTDAAQDQPPALAINGTPCTSETECNSGFCTDNVCCDKLCAGDCFTCAASATPGACVAAAAGSDPRDKCLEQDVSTCGTDGTCNGSGTCRLYGAGEVCSSVSACNSGASAVVSLFSCNGTGTCAPQTQQSCNGFRCTNATCLIACTTDADCAPGAFCSAGSCVQTPNNLAGDGDLEYGTGDGWSFFSGGVLALNNTSTGGIAHSGLYSVADTARGQLYQGPSYNLPTGPGQYTITAWGLQKDDTTMNGALQVKLVCASATASYAQVGVFSTVMNLGLWTKFTGTIDTSASPVTADCFPNATPPGVVKSATLYLNQISTATPTALPDLYIDDLVVQVTDGHNLVGNPNFEAGTTDGWSVNGVGSLAASTVYAHGGTHSLAVTTRGTTASGPRYALPLGAGEYNVVFNVHHTGATAHDLVLQSNYTCLQGPLTLGPIIATVPAVAPGATTWTQLTGTVTLPPAGAPPNCRLTEAAIYVQQEAGTCTGAGQIECPDIYVDDVSITLGPLN